MTAIVLNPKLGDAHPSPVQKVWTPFNLILQSFNQSTTSSILYMQYSSVAMSCLQGGSQSIAIAIKGHTKLLQTLNAVRRILY
jgi:hypothetical protein